jgi:hypothetical protein
MLRTYSVVDGQVTPLTAPTPLDALGGSVRWISPTASGVQVFVWSEGTGRVATVGAPGEVSFIDGVLPQGLPIAAEPGALFLLVTAEAGRPYIAEVKCADG